MIHVRIRKTIVFFSLPLFSLLYVKQVEAWRLTTPVEDGVFVPYFMELIESHGRSAEWHNVTTEDGFILSVFRILSNPSVCQQVGKRRVVFIQHGLEGAADFFIMYGPTRSLAYALSDAGYDVWLGNFRGNVYSKRHQFLLVDDARFWNFSLDDQALLDLPAMIDYVLKATGQTSLTYVSHSSSCTAALMLLSDRPNYNQKMNLNVMLAPIVFWKFSSRAAKVYATPFRQAKKIIPSGAVHFLVRHIARRSFFERRCFQSSVAFKSCFFLVDLITGQDHEQLDRETVTTFLNYYPAGSSLKIFYHYIQHLDSGKFRHYDYGSPERNLQYYGRIEPPDYNLKKVTTPSVILRAPNDPLSSRNDTELLISELRNSPMIYDVIKERKFNHIDFLVAKDVKKLVIDPLLQIFRKVHGPQC
ncbi:lipase 3 [Diachasma alloeum]|uniref:lipase 3 n=1 Tax=Diachasma alloeum TaxID=454923 RepID=UPI00073824AD|nr:lipase 3 [Diachasma alloeum]